MCFAIFSLKLGTVRSSTLSSHISKNKTDIDCSRLSATV